MASEYIKGFFSLLNGAHYNDRLEKYLLDIRRYSSNNARVATLAKAYMLMKRECEELYFDKDFRYLYEASKNNIRVLENEFYNSFIIKSNPKFSFLDERFIGKDIYQFEDEELLDYIVWFTRISMFERNRDVLGSNIDINTLPLDNYCTYACNMIKMLCMRMRINCSIIKIPAAYSDEVQIYGGNGFHFFCYIDMYDKQYIVDPTYRQFFRVENNVLERMGVMRLNGCAPGIYMTMNESRMNTAKTLLEQGWIEATWENVKNYLDGFTLSFRNGLYYEKLGRVDYTVDYGKQDYFNFLNGIDSQINHEPIDCLGSQERPLENYKMKFR